MEDASISLEDTGELWIAGAKRFLEDMDRVPRAILFGIHGKHLAQTISVGEDPQPNEYFDPLSAAEKMHIQNGLQSLHKYRSNALEAYYGLNWDTDPD
eukprot:11432937-Karenia_brevis.AAC.1